MKLISIEELKRRGWRVEGRKVPRDIAPGYEWEFDLFAPDGTKIATSQFVDMAWRECPDIPEDGFSDDYSWATDEEVAFFDPRDKDAIEQHIKDYGCYGTSQIILTPHDLEALKSGKCIVWGLNEYTSIIYYHDEQKGD